MARIKGGILGKMSGKSGPVVGAINRGVNILKTAPLKSIKRARNGPQTQNYRIGVMRPFLKIIEKALAVGYKNVKSTLSTMNQAMSYNTVTALRGQEPNFEVNYPRVLISKGSREPFWALKAELVDRRTFRISWEVPETAKIKLIGDDMVNYLCFNETAGKAWFKATGTRKDFSTDCVLPANFPAGLVHIWVFFESPDGKNTSRSDYLGSVLFS